MNEHVAEAIIRKLQVHFCDTDGVVDSAVIDTYIELTPEEIEYLRATAAEVREP